MQLMQLEGHSTDSLCLAAIELETKIKMAHQRGQIHSGNRHSEKHAKKVMLEFCWHLETKCAQTKKQSVPIGRTTGRSRM